MDSQLFINSCKHLVLEYTNFNEKSDLITYGEVYAVWSAKALQNNKALLSTTKPDGMYYEITYNGDKEEFYFDAYKREFNKAISLDHMKSGGYSFE